MMRELSVDVAVIGSGASGAVMAYNLARKNLRVAVVERGTRYDPTTFEHLEVDMFARVYKECGLQSSKDRDLTVAQGATVGGSTVINNAIWLRCDLDRVLPEWAKLGARVERAPLEAAYQELERNLHVSPITDATANRGASVFLRGAKAIGLAGRYLTHNRSDCLGCGWCNYGCRYNRKTSMLVTYLPWAEQLGAEIIDRCDDVKIAHDGRRARGVTFTREGEPTIVNARKVVCCAGAVGSSSVLLASDIRQGGRVGGGFHLLGGILVAGEMEEKLDGFDGIGLCCIAPTTPDVVIESYFAPPFTFAITLGGWFLQHFERMLNFDRYAMAGVMTATAPRGRISLDRHGRTVIDLRYEPAEIDRLKKGLATLARIYFAAGARRVLPATFKVIEFTSEADLAYIDDLVKAPEDLLIGSAHPQGGNPMNEDPNRGVVGLDFRVHGFENLYVADTSVWPSNIVANCQATAMAMSQHASSFVAGAS